MSQLSQDLHIQIKKKIELEDRIKSLKSQIYSLNESILHLGVPLGKSEEETVEHIIEHDKSAAGILWFQKLHYQSSEASRRHCTKDIVGVVATLAKVDDDNLSRLLSEYLGLKTMMAVVCKTYDGVKALEKYKDDGSVSLSSGIHELGTLLGKHMDGRYLVICLQDLRPYYGEFINNDFQRRLDLLNPKLPNGQTPPGFLGFAVNMLNIDCTNLYGLTNDGSGLRETLFYNLFSRLQVYTTRECMLQALPCISDGAISLDGGIIKNKGTFFLGKREYMDVKFPKSCEPRDIDLYQSVLQNIKVRRDRLLGEMEKLQGLLDIANSSL